MQNMNNMTLPKEILWILEQLETAGFVGYVVGGCVRDFLLGRPVGDYDITTDATPEQVMGMFSHDTVLPTGIAHGTVTLMLGKNSYEITTHRSDGVYSDGRRPDTVMFSKDIICDLARRDFTINAMAYHPQKGLIDPFHGREDLEKRVIRTVGNPRERFQEDALRIMRGLRFASVLGFTIEDETARCIHEQKQLLERISPERFRVELMKLIIGEEFERVLREYPQVISVWIPEILPMIGFLQHTPYHIYDIWEHTLHAMAGVEAEPLLRLTMLLHDIAKPSCFFRDEKGVGHFYTHSQKGAVLATEILKRLRFDQKTIRQVALLIEYHYISLDLGKNAAKRLLQKIGEENFRLLLKVRAADDGAKSPRFQGEFADTGGLEQLLEEILQENACISLAQLAISGTDLLNLGMTPSPEIGEILQMLLEEVMDELLPNEEKALQARARILIKSRTK